MTAGLFGRSPEFSLLEEMLARVAGGVAGIAFIEGEPGIGKTALLQAVTASARERGFGIFAGRAEELEQDRPFRSIVEALSSTRADRDERRDEIARLYTSGTGGDGVFYRLIDAIEDLVEAEALSGPVLLTIDDLQWADPGTIRALGTIWRTMAAFPLAVIATLRPLPRSDELTMLLTNPANAIRVTLQPLHEAAILEIVEGRLGATPGPRLRTHIDGAGGNPFFILELLKSLAAESALEIDGTRAEIQGSALPPSLVATILHRLGRLPGRVLEILRSAAVLGASFRIEDLATAAEVTDGEALAAVAVLRNESVFADDGEKVRFSHDLIRGAVYEDLGEPARTSMHRRIGYALAATGADPLEVAGHLVLGARSGDVEAANWMIRAANSPALDHRSMKALIERAHEICPDHPERGYLIMRHSQLLTQMGRPADGIGPLARLVPQLSGPERVSTLLTLMTACVNAGRSREAKTWAQQIPGAVEALGVPDRPGLSTLLSRAAQVRGDLEGALAEAERAVEMEGEGAYTAEANMHLSFLLCSLKRPREALVRSEKALSLVGSAEFRYWANVVSVWCHIARACALGDLDRAEEAENSLASARMGADEWGLTIALAKGLMESAHLLYSLGRWDDALVDAETAAAISDEANFVYTSTPDPGCIMLWIAYRRQDDSEFDRLRSSRRSLDAGDAPLRPTLEAVEAFDRGDVETACEAARVVLSRIAAAPTESRDFDVLPALARIAMLGSDEESARLALDTAITLADISDAPGPALAAARCRSIVDGDVSAASQAVELARASPRKALAAEALEEAAAVQNRDTAVELLQEALGLYDQMGAIRDRGRVAGRLKELGANGANVPARTRAVSGWDALTAAEVAVVRLATQGLTNREIGSKLCVSHRTIETHLSHVFEKLQLRSRVQLAREAAQRLGGVATG